jgi:hypothetical protein
VFSLLAEEVYWLKKYWEDKTMPKISSLLSRLLLASLTAISVAGGVAWAQQPPTVRIRGTIEAVDGSLLTVKARDGAEMKVRITDNAAVIGVTAIAMSEIKSGSYIGVSAMPQPDGTQKALAVHIFPEAQRGVAEGFRPWDLRPNSTMTNATVAETVAGTDGQNIVVKYKDGEKSELKSGAAIAIAAATKKPDGTYSAARINVGRNGIVPN